jgi:hypothetical protein
MRLRGVLLVARLAVPIGCGGRTDLVVVEESALPADSDADVDAGAGVAPDRVDRCAVFTTLSDCLRARCEFYECGTGPVDADFVPMHSACASPNGPVPAACR